MPDPVATTTISAVGKAIAEAIHKDGRDGAKDKEKPTKKEKDVRRHSSIPPPRPSLDHQTIKKAKEISPDSKTITKHSRRSSTLPKAADDTSSPPSAFSSKPPVTRSATLRPRSSAGNGSALPKYRPRSMLVEPTQFKKPASSPPRKGVRRRLSSSDDDVENADDKNTLQPESPTSVQKVDRPISPLPHRSALKVNLTTAMTIRPSTPEKKPKAKGSVPTPQTTPHRDNTPTKTSMIASSSSRSAIPRPPSSASSSSSVRSNRTPKTPISLKGVFNRSAGSGNQSSGYESSPLRRGAPGPPDSPLGMLSARRKAKTTPATKGKHRAIDISPALSTDNSVDSIDAHDVEFMLGSVASPTAPTPALPRMIRTTSKDSGTEPQTPTRPLLALPGRANLSYQSPAPPSNDGSPFLRPKPRHPGKDRSSILSWEQLALHNQSLGQDDIEHMLSETAAPFRPGAISPAPSSLPDIPESPSLSALPSPTTYGSISQVLLPDVTPSPAMFNATLRFDHMAAEAPTEGATVTLLKLQLASLEDTARSQMLQIQSLESQLQSTKVARLRDAEELSQQISALEEQIHGNLKTEEQRLEYTTSLEAQLTNANVDRERAVEEALEVMKKSINDEHMVQLQRHHQACLLGSCARDTSVLWNAARIRPGASASVESVNLLRYFPFLSI
ncbi:hypothetical protein ABKN59_009316 [Abortiporus biennis]